VIQLTKHCIFSALKLSPPQINLAARPKPIGSLKSPTPKMIHIYPLTSVVIKVQSMTQQQTTKSNTILDVKINKNKNIIRKMGAGT
jgi:hypothetical protein